MAVPTSHSSCRNCSSESSRITRRQALTGLAAVIGGAAVATSRSHAQESGGQHPIDLHHHFFPPVAKALYGPFPPLQNYSPEMSLESMGRVSVQKSYLSLPAQLGDDPAAIRDKAIGFAREVNEYAARQVSDYKDRFGFFAYLPLPDIDSSLKEIEYAFDTLGADGVGLLTSYGNHWLGDSVFQPVFDELNRRKTIVYSHPTDGPCCHNLLTNTIPHTVEWNTDTSRAIYSLINDGTDRPPVTTPVTSTATRYPNIKFVWSHGGGTLLGLVGRFLGHGGTQNVRSAELSGTPEPDSRLYHLRRFYYDTALSANPVQMQALKALVGGSQIVFGSDFPFMQMEDTVEALQECGFDKQELMGVYRDNALRMFGA